MVESDPGKICHSVSALAIVWSFRVLWRKLLKGSGYSVTDFEITLFAATQGGPVAQVGAPNKAFGSVRLRRLPGF